MLLHEYKNLVTVLRRGCTVKMSLQKHSGPPRFYETLEFSVTNLVGENIAEVSISCESISESISKVEQVFVAINDKIAANALDNFLKDTI